MNEDYCAFLHLSIAVKAELHYDTLKAARVLQLTDSFQHKLGYLVGSMYSRVGTEDWIPDACDAAEFDRRKREPLEDQSVVIWLERSIHKVVVPKLEKMPNATVDDLQRLVQETKVKQENQKGRVLDAVSAVLTESGLEQVDREKIVRRLENRPDFQTAFK